MGEMISKRTLRSEVDELRAELASLRYQAENRAKPAPADKPAEKSETAKPDEPDEQAAETGDLEQMLKDLAEVGEKEIAEHPALAVGLAFILGVLVGRATKA